MTHPAVLHASNSCWSLRRSWAVFRDLNTTADDDAGTIQAWRPNPGRNGNGHGDGIATAVVTHTGTTTHRARIIEQVTDDVTQARWLAASALRQQPMATGPALAQIGAALRAVDPSTAADIHRRLDHADQLIRRAIRLAPNQWPLPSAPPCPACGQRLLRAQTAAPTSADWTVVCTNNGCRCHGPLCACAMPIREARVRHVWNARSELVASAIAGVALAQQAA